MEKNKGFKLLEYFSIKDDKASCLTCGTFMECNSGAMKNHAKKVHDVEFSQSTEKKEIALSNSKCEICGKSFKYLQNMKYHFNTVHESGNNVLICSACARSYKTKALLRTHVRRVHEGLKTTTYIST